MEQVFSYIISLGASVMMPILFTIIGLCIGMKFGKSLKSGLYVGVGFVGLGIVTALLTNNFGSPLSEISRLYDLQLGVFDMGWPAAAAVAYNTAVGALIIPICLGVNFLLLITKCTRTVNIDLWNYWHFAFIGAVAYFVMDQSLAWGYFAAIVCYIITLVMADLTAEKFQGYYDDMDGISIPQPFCQSFTAFAIAINWLLDKIPGFSKLDIDAEGLKKKFGVLGEPIVLGVIVGALIGAVAQLDIKKVLFLGVTMGAVMELIPRITKLFIDGLKPIAEKTQEVVQKKWAGKKVYIGMSPALVIGHPTTLVASLILIPLALLMAVALPGNEFLPLASLAGMFYVFVMVLPYTKGNVVKTLIIGIVAVGIGLWFVTDMAPAFTQAAQTVYAQTQDPAAKIPEGFQAGAIDFASSLFGWVIYKCVDSLAYVGAGILSLITIAMVFINRKRIVADEAKAQAQEADRFVGAQHVKFQTACHPEDVKHYDTPLLRERFVMEKVMAPDSILLTYSHYDRFIFGGAMPVAKTLKLENFWELGLDVDNNIKEKYFMYNRELGVVNCGEGDGVVIVDGKEYALSPKEALYIGRGHIAKDKDVNKEVLFRSKDAKKPAKFYLNSATAHQHYKTQWITLDGRKGSLKAAVWGPVGSLEECNNRTVYKLIVNDVLEEGPCQLQLGLTQLNPGAAWNTMPPHTHGRRIEAYYYFNLPQEQTIAHIMGQPEESRVVWLHNEQAIMSPEWSMHAAAGTYYYTFIWGMAGENLYYNDKDNIPVIDIR